MTAFNFTIDIWSREGGYRFAFIALNAFIKFVFLSKYIKIKVPSIKIVKK